MAGEFRPRHRDASTGKLLSRSHTGRRNHTLLSWRKYRCLVPARQRDGATARGGEAAYERSHRSACFWQKTSTALGRCEQNEDAVQLQNEDFGLWVLPGSGMGPLDDQGKRHMKKLSSYFGPVRKLEQKHETMLQRPDDSPFPGLARDPLPGQRHEGFPA